MQVVYMPHAPVTSWLNPCAPCPLARWPQDTDKWAPVAALLPKEGYPFRIQCDKRHPLVGDKEGAKEHSAFKTAVQVCFNLGQFIKS